MAKKGYKNIIIEGGVSEAEILNNYLTTGNEKLLQKTRAKGENYRAFIKKIKQLSNRNGYPKLQFIGIDFERAICLEYLFSQWFSGNQSPKLQEPIKKLLQIKANTKPKKIKKIILEIKNKYPQYEVAFANSLGAKALV